MNSRDLIDDLDVLLNTPDDNVGTRRIKMDATQAGQAGRDALWVLSAARAIGGEHDCVIDRACTDADAHS